MQDLLTTRIYEDQLNIIVAQTAGGDGALGRPIGAPKGAMFLVYTRFSSDDLKGIAGPTKHGMNHPM